MYPQCERMELSQRCQQATSNSQTCVCNCSFTHTVMDSLTSQWQEKIHQNLCYGENGLELQLPQKYSNGTIVREDSIVPDCVISCLQTSSLNKAICPCCGKKKKKTLESRLHLATFNVPFSKWQDPPTELHWGLETRRWFPATITEGLIRCNLIKPTINFTQGTSWSGEKKTLYKMHGKTDGSAWTCMEKRTRMLI